MADTFIESGTRSKQAEASRVGKVVATLLSAVLIIGLPAVFWLSLFELVNYVFGIGLGVSARLTVAAILVSVRALIWAMIMAIGRRNGN